MRLVEHGNGKASLKGVQLWSSGVFRGFGSPPEGDQFRSPDLDSMVKAANETRLHPRAYYGHPLNPMLKLMARPQGEVKNFRRVGDTIVADFEDMPAHVARQAVEDRVRLSPDMAKNFTDPLSGKVYPWAITGVAMLGAVQPGNTALPNLGDQLLLGDDTHYAMPELQAMNRAFAAEGVRSFVIAPERFPASSLDYRRLQAQRERVQQQVSQGETRSFAASEKSTPASELRALAQATKRFRR